MIHYIQVTNHLGETLDIEMTRPEKSGLVIKDISGLGPSKATINVTKLATKDGGTYNSANIEARNIVLKLGCYRKEGDKSFTIEDARQLTYKYFPVKRKITFIIKTDNRHVKTEGYVESNEVSIFSENEESNVSIICPDPFFYEVDSSSDDKGFTGIISNFEFPFSNKSLTEKLLKFGTIRKHNPQAIYYNGEYKIGLTIRMHAKGEIVNPRLINTTTNETMSINTEEIKNLTGKGFVAGDEIIINTRKGAKSVLLFRNGEVINILSSLVSYQTWFTLEKGENMFTYDTESGGSDVIIRYSWETAYEGV